jgi:hypothetical protein
VRRHLFTRLQRIIDVDSSNQSVHMFKLRSGFLIPLIALALCTIRLLRLVQLYSVNVFIGDHWVYHEPTLFRRVSWWAIFRWESNPWREGIGGLLAVWVEPFFRWNSRAESFISTALLVAGCILALWLKTRLIRPLEFWDFLIPVFVITPAGYETTVISTHFSHGPLPFMLLMGISLAWTVSNPRTRYLLIAVLTALSISTGFGFMAGIIVPALVLVELYCAKAGTIFWPIAALIIIGLAWTLFLTHYSAANTGCPAAAIHTRNPFHYFLFVAFMFANSLGLKAPQYLVPSIIFGSLLLIFVLAICVGSLRYLKNSPVPFLLISFSLTFAVATSLGRMCLGLGTAVGSRYIIYLAPAFLGMYLFALLLERTKKIWLLLVLSGLALGCGITHGADRDAMIATSSLRANWKNCYLTKHDLIDCNQLTGATPQTYPGTIQDKIDFLERSHLNLFAD